MMISQINNSSGMTTSSASYSILNFDIESNRYAPGQDKLAEEQNAALVDRIDHRSQVSI